MRANRASNIELLRIIAMFFVVALHYIGKGGMLLPYGDENFTFNNGFFWLIEAYAYVAVNVYALIAGYFLVDAKFKIVRVVKIWLQVIFYSAGIWMIMLLLGQVAADYQNAFWASMFLLPITSEHYWFARSYIFLCMLAPFLSVAVRSMTRVQLKTCIIVLMMLFSSVWRTLLPMSTPIDDKGYGIIWFVCLFMVAAYIKLYVPQSDNWKKPMMIYLSTSLALFLSMLCIGFVTQKIGKMTHYYDVFYEYNAPFTIIGSIGLFLAFRNIHIKSVMMSRVINKLAGLTFGVYLLHEHTLLRNLWRSLWKVPELGQSSWYIPHFIGAILCVYVVGSTVEWIRQLIFGWMGKLLHVNVVEQKMSVLDKYFNANQKENS